MLKKILDSSSCAECRLCCVFDRYDIWETPVFTEKIRDRILDLKPDTEFVEPPHIMRTAQKAPMAD